MVTLVEWKATCTGYPRRPDTAAFLPRQSYHAPPDLEVRLGLRQSGSLRLLRQPLRRGPARLPDRKENSAHNVLRHAAIAKLIQLKGVLSNVGALLGQVPDSLGPKDERDRIRASYCLDGGYHSVVARITRKARRVLRVDQDHIDVMFFQPLHGFVERPRKLL